MASTTEAAISAPCPPAFIRTAPPTVPGIPTHHSRPLRPAPTDRLANTGINIAPPASTMSPSTVTAFSVGDGDITMTTPSKPLSAIRRLLPRPITRVSTPGCRRKTSDTATTWSADDTLTTHEPLPPTPYVVNGPSALSL